MNEQSPPTFVELRQRFQLLRGSTVCAIPLRRALEAGDDPMHILSYIGELGVRVETLQQLYVGINGLEDEEELSAFECQEGIAVSVASDDHWILFTD